CLVPRAWSGVSPSWRSYLHVIASISTVPCGADRRRRATARSLMPPFPGPVNRGHKFADTRMNDLSHLEPMKRPKSSSAVARIVSALRTSILSAADGEYLGSEEQLTARYGVSRPTLRQAVRLLEHERLLVIKRGSGGGFYARRPQIDAVAHAAAIYLDIEQATFRDLITASLPLLTEAVQLAAACRDERLHARLRQLLVNDDPEAGKMEGRPDEVFAWDIEFARIIGDMCGNPVIKLFVSIIYE